MIQETATIKEVVTGTISPSASSLHLHDLLPNDEAVQEDKEAVNEYFVSL